MIRSGGHASPTRGPPRTVPSRRLLRHYLRYRCPPGFCRPRPTHSEAARAQAATAPPLARAPHPTRGGALGPRRVRGCALSRTLHSCAPFACAASLLAWSCPPACLRIAVVHEDSLRHLGAPRLRAPAPLVCAATDHILVARAASFRQVGASAAVLRAGPSSGVAPQRLAACPSRTALPRRLGTVRLRAFARVRLRAVVRQDRTLASRRRRPARATLCLLWHRSALPRYARLRTRLTGGVVGRWVVHTFGRPALSGCRRVHPPTLCWRDALSRPVFIAHCPVCLACRLVQRAALCGPCRNDRRHIRCVVRRVTAPPAVSRATARAALEALGSTFRNVATVCRRQRSVPRAFVVRLLPSACGAAPASFLECWAAAPSPPPCSSRQLFFSPRRAIVDQPTQPQSLRPIAFDLTDVGRWWARVTNSCRLAGRVRRALPLARLRLLPLRSVPRYAHTVV